MARTALILTAVGALALGTAMPAAASGPGKGHGPDKRNSRAIHTYVNLGDSYSAGVGLEPLAAGSPAVCRQAQGNHAHLLAAVKGYRLKDVSCSGAKTTDFFSSQHPETAPQLDALSRKTDLVTMMIGGNDNDVFGTALNACNQLGYLSGGQGSPCKDAYGSSFETTVETKTYPALVRAFQAVKTKAPKAKVAVIGYPRLMPETGSCFPQMLIASGDAAYVNSLQTTLNSAIEKAAKETGVTYVDAYAASSGHDACKPVGTRWVEPVVGYVTKEKAHPNQLGEAAIAALTARTLRLR